MHHGEDANHAYKQHTLGKYIKTNNIFIVCTGACPVGPGGPYVNGSKSYIFSIHCISCSPGRGCCGIASTWYDGHEIRVNVTKLSQRMVEIDKMLALLSGTPGEDESKASEEGC